MSMMMFFGNGPVPTASEKSDVEIEGSTSTTTNKKAFNCQYKSSYSKYGFISISDLETPYPLWLICKRKLSNDAKKPAKLVWHLHIKHPELKDKSLDFFKRKKSDHAAEKRLLRTLHHLGQKH